MADSPHIFNANQDNFETDVLEMSFSTPVLVDFWAPWCAPCKQLMPTLAKIVDGAAGTLKLAKVNTDEEMALAGSFGIRSLPTVVLFKDGRPVDGFMGVQPESAIRGMLARHLTEAAEPAQPEPEPEAEPDLDAEDLGAVISGLQAAIKAEPKKHELQAELADALLRAGLVNEGVAVLDQLPSDVQDHDVSRRARARLGFISATEHAPGEAELQAAITQQGSNLLARYQLGARCVLAGRYAAGMDQFLAILKADRKFEEDLGRRALLDAFRLIDDTDLIGDYRRRMTSLLF